MKSSEPDHTTHTLKLSDGRTLAYAIFGIPNGKPVFFFHGWPASRNSAKKFDGICKKLKVRLISPDRPGFGRSDFQQNRILLDWPDDVMDIAKKLKLKKFAVLGVSGGGPYAAVCGYKIPEHITRLGIVVGLGPIRGYRSLEGIPAVAKIGWMNFHRPVFRRLESVFTLALARYGSMVGLDRLFFLARNDKRIYNDSQIQRSVNANILEAFRQGLKGPERDLELYAGDWGFSLDKIRTKTFLWYGSADRNVSLSMGRYYHEKIKGSILNIVPDAGHLISVSHAEEIFRTLIA